GVTLGTAVTDGVGTASPEPATTCSVADAWQVAFQQMSTVWSPRATSRGTVMYAFTLPLASAVNGKTRTLLCSWMLPGWWAGTCVAVTWTVWPSAAVLGVSVRGVPTSRRQTPRNGTSSPSAPAPIANRRQSRRRLGLMGRDAGGAGPA